MKQSSLQFQITRLQQAKMNTTVESIAVVVLALFVSAILPSLLVRYYYADQQLFEQPQLLEYIPVVAFVLGAGYGIFAFAINFLRSRKIKQLSEELDRELLFADSSCCGQDCGSSKGCCSDSFSDFDSSDDDWADAESFEELDRMVDEVIAENESKKNNKPMKSSSSKSTKKSAGKSASKSANKSSKKK